MARIRSIKPDFFRHRRLYLAEIETELPLRVAFAGLWCCADREGRFKWEPEELKLDCLPFDELEFSRVLDALTTRQFIVGYTVDGRKYGFIPGFRKHQVVNNRESASQIPDPPENKDLTTREAREDDASATRHDLAQAEGKGREGKGKEKSEVGRNGHDVLNTRELRKEALEVLGFLNEKTRRNYQPVPANVDMIVARLRQGATVGDCRAVIAKKCREWAADEKMAQYLRPATLFNATKFAQYQGELAPAGTA